MLEAEQLAHLFVEAALHDVRFAHAKCGHLVEWEINSPERGVFFYVAQNVRELESHAERNGVIARLRMTAAEDINADQSDRARHAKATLMFSLNQMWRQSTPRAICFRWIPCEPTVPTSTFSVYVTPAVLKKSLIRDHQGGASR